MHHEPRTGFLSFEGGLGLVAVVNLAVLAAVAAGVLPWRALVVSGSLLGLYVVAFLVDQYRQYRDWNRANQRRESGD